MPVGQPLPVAFEGQRGAAPAFKADPHPVNTTSSFVGLHHHGVLRCICDHGQGTVLADTTSQCSVELYACFGIQQPCPAPKVDLNPLLGRSCRRWSCAGWWACNHTVGTRVAVRGLCILCTWTVGTCRSSDHDNTSKLADGLNPMVCRVPITLHSSQRWCYTALLPHSEYKGSRSMSTVDRN